MLLAEYRVSERMRLMAGFVRDYSPQPRFSMTPLLPDANRSDYSLGLTYDYKGYELTAAYMLVDFDERSTVVNGEGVQPEGFDATYKTYAHIPTFGISKSF